MIVLIVKMFQQNKVNRQLAPIIELIHKIDDEDAFLKGCEDGIARAKTDVEKTKYQVLQLWGLTKYGRYDEYDEKVREVNLAVLINKQNPNDDSLFYMILAIPNIMQKDHEEERCDALLKKVKDEVPDAEKRLDYQIGMACLDAYFNRGDKGVAFFESVMEGNYGEYEYAKNLISLYKEIVGTMLYRYYTLTDQKDNSEDVLPMAESFMETRIGETWLQNIGVKLPDGTEEEEQAEDQDDSAEESEKETETEEAEEEEETEESGSGEDKEEETEAGDDMSSTGSSFADENKERNE
jgi:hypothetical protein